jgi:type VI secretion system secreted protein Hcp
MDIILLQPGDPDIVYAPANPRIDGLPAAVIGGFDPSLCVPLTAFGQELKAPASATAPPATAFTVLKPIDALSVKLYEFCLRARPLGVGHDRPSYLHRVSTINGAGVLMFSVALRDAVIADIQLQAQADGSTVERLTLAPSEMLWTYYSGAGKLHTGWSTLRNRPIIIYT